MFGRIATFTAIAVLMFGCDKSPSSTARDAGDAREARIGRINYLFVCSQRLAAGQPYLIDAWV